ncbi:hypothetical protein B0H17DRAFT_1325715 [Mycena rosella]|uniref:PWWP domain-containing protein n=1 Tax=Mycena rosella TaxID=1033263 RepID=A0AAD7M9V0_MYCRO|nr:hypothetical protein B0H17DRAFT_1325715 [Mycena rosella]
MSSRAPRQAAKKANTKFQAQLMASPPKPPDDKSPAKAPKRVRSRPTLKQVPNSSKRSATAPRPSAQPRPGSRKPPISLDSRKSDGEESDLTSLSARTASPSPRSKAVSSGPKLVEPDGDLSNLTYVWVLVDLNGEVYGLEHEDDGKERVWWPGVVRSEGSTYRVQLFGKIGALESDSIVEVAAPHSGNLVSYCDASDKIRYTAPHYEVTNSQSPKKRQKLDRSTMEAEWHDALSKFVEAIENEMPSLSFLASVRGIKTRDAGKVNRKSKGKGRAQPEDDPPDDPPDDSRWSPPPPDSSLTIPGELLLARDKQLYWPARILSYVPPATSNDPPQYRIQWMDDCDSRSSEATLDRSMFFVYEDKEFGTCNLGKFDSVFEEVINDTDAPRDAAPDGRLSPEPRGPPPSGDAFADLGLHEQFAYTKPVLQAILRDEYPPAQKAHKLFIGGGRGRNSVVKEAGERGLMDPRDVELLQKLLTEWCMRETRAENADPEEAAVEEAVADDAAEVRTDDAEQSGLAIEEVVADDAAEARTNEAQQSGVAIEEKVEAPNADGDALEKATDTEKDNAEAQALAAESNIDAVVADTNDEPLRDEPMRDIEVAEDPALLETLCAPASPTATVIDERGSSPALPPPSSSFSPDNDVPMEGEETDVPVPSASAPIDLDVDDDAGNVFDTSSTLSEASDVSDLVPRAKPPRQIGCDAYEGLSTVEKMDYCLNVLLPELLIQIFLWRSGRRSSVALLSEVEEMRLHKLGEEEKRRTDWVFDVKRLRAQKEREINKKIETVVVGGTASRPKRALRHKPEIQA